MNRAFTIFEALIAVALSAVFIVLLVTQSGTNFRFFAQSDDTLASARALQLLLAYLKADVSMMDAPPWSDLRTSPETGRVFPKNFMHLAQDPDSSTLKLFTFTMTGEAATPLPSGDPIAAKDPADPRTRLALAQAARVQNAMAWVDASTQLTDPKPRMFVVNVRNGGIVQPVTYTYYPDKKDLVRLGPEGATHIGTGAIAGFVASPYLEFLVPRQPDRPLELLKCWVDVRIDVLPSPKADPIAKKMVQIRTKLVPKMLIALSRGVSPF